MQNAGLIPEKNNGTVLYMTDVFFHHQSLNTFKRLLTHFVSATTNSRIMRNCLWKVVDTILFVIFRRKYINQEQTADDILPYFW